VAVTATNPEYSYWKEEWEKLRACIKGQRYVKASGEKYLPKSAGQRAIEEKFCKAGKGPYEMYKDGARFPDIVDSTVKGFVGLATRTPWTIEGMPSSMDYLLDDAGNGIPLVDWQGLLINEGLEVGRYALFPDAPPESMGGGLPKIAWYQTECVTNWKLARGKPNLVVLKEIVDIDGIDMFEHDEEVQYRVIRMEGNTCLVEVYDENDRMITEQSEILKHHEGYCPVVIGGAMNNDWTVDKPPMSGIADCALAYYKLSAQQRWAIRSSCDPMFLALGFAPGEIQIWGGGSVFEKDVKPGDAAIEVIEIDGKGIAKATEQMQAEIDQAEKMSHMLTDKASAESGTSLRQRTNSKTASLKSVDRCAAAAMEKALNILAKMQGVGNEIFVTSAFDYTDEEIDAVAVEKISQVVERGHLPEESLIEYVQKRGMLEGYDLKQIRLLLDEDEERRIEKAAAFFPQAQEQEFEPVDDGE
jgi:hypothetical protein